LNIKSHFFYWKAATKKYQIII